jgi:hypothetical protein
MSTFRRAAATALIACLAAAVLVPVAGAISKPQTLRFQTKLTSLTPVPVSGQTSAAPQPGDYTVITDDYLRNGKVVGHDVVHCVLVTLTSSLCNISVSLPRGDIEAQGRGPGGGTGRFTVAVVGGTGAYANARGTVTFASGPDNTGTEVFHLRP